MNPEIAAKFLKSIKESQKKSKEEENIAYCTLGVLECLNLLIFGISDFDAKMEIENVFGKNEFDFKKKVEGITSAMGVWFGKPGINEKFVEYAKNAEIQVAEFETVELINEWASNCTKGKISKALESVNADMVCLFVHVFYFESQWNTPFKVFQKFSSLEINLDLAINSTLTTIQNWNKKKNAYIKTDVTQPDFQFNGKPTDAMVSVSSERQAIRTKIYDGLFIDYNIPGLYGLFVKPKFGHSVEDVIEKISIDGKKEFSNRVLINSVLTTAPFTISTEINFKKPMKNLGINKIFKTGHLNNLHRNPGTVVDKFYQNVHLSVDANGTIAAAVTVMEIIEKCCIQREYLDMRLENPFLFILVNDTGDIYFMSIVNQIPSLGDTIITDSYSNQYYEDEDEDDY